MSFNKIYSGMENAPQAIDENFNNSYPKDEILTEETAAALGVTEDNPTPEMAFKKITEGATGIAMLSKPERYDVPFLPDYTAHSIGVNAVWVNQFNEVTLNVAVARKDGKNIEVGLVHIAKLPVGTRPSSHIYTRGYQNDNGIIVGSDGGINLRIDIPANYVGFSVSYIAEN